MCSQKMGGEGGCAQDIPTYSLGYKQREALKAARLALKNSVGTRRDRLPSKGKPIPDRSA